MTNSQDSQQWQALLADYVLGDVTPEEAETVHQLLITHPELHQELDYLQETLSLIPLALPESSLPKNLGKTILQLAQAETDSPLSTVSLERKKSLVGLFALGTIAFSFILGLGFYNYRLHQELAIAQAQLSQYQDAIAALPESNNRLLSLKGTQKAPMARGVVLIMPKTHKAMMTVQNLSTLPEGKVYRLWAVANGKKFDCGKFNANEKGQVIKEMPLDDVIANTSMLVVTIEPTESVAQPTGIEVMTGSI
jgi:anti-sigma-K factor RskA